MTGLIRIFTGLFVSAVWVVVGGFVLLFVGSFIYAAVSDVRGEDLFMYFSLAIFVILIAWNWNGLFPGKSTQVVPPSNPGPSHNDTPLAGKSFHIEGSVTIDGQKDTLEGIISVVEDSSPDRP